ncbi:MAG TPA: biopolymer transporter ExbD [Bacteroidia bacterium]|jgi:biopolymer transport protein ExbD|nr:biopolymer transporter ExbD [Bacteroidia bacterium]
MADVDSGGGSGGGHGKHQKKRAKKLSTRIDMTPMVDLGFLLLTFFMLTTTFSKPKVIGLTPPIKSDKKTEVDTTSLTIVLSGNNKIYYYKGQLPQDLDSTNMKIRMSDFSPKGIRQVILNFNNFVNNQVGPGSPVYQKYKSGQINDSVYDKLKDSAEAKHGAMFVIIKTDSLAKYVNVVSMLDEMDICNVGLYSLIDASKADINIIRDYNNKNNIR